MLMWGCVMLACAACARQPAPAGTASAVAGSAGPAAMSAAPSSPGQPASSAVSGDEPPPHIRGADRPGGAPLSTAEIYAPFPPSAQHSAIEADAVAWTPHRIHSYRGGDDLPPLRALSPVLASTRSLSVLPEAVRVQAEPNALVAAWADQLGCFCTGSRGIVVRADAAGVAVIDVKTGVDAGAYPVFVASPSRSGLLVFSIGAR